MSKPNLFWMVAGAGPSHMRHPTREVAEREAMRLARANPGQWFYVVEAQSAHRVAGVESVTLRDWSPTTFDGGYLYEGA